MTKTDPLAEDLPSSLFAAISMSLKPTPFGSSGPTVPFIGPTKSAIEEARHGCWCLADAVHTAGTQLGALQAAEQAHLHWTLLGGLRGLGPMAGFRLAGPAHPTARGNQETVITPGLQINCELSPESGLDRQLSSVHQGENTQCLISAGPRAQDYHIRRTIFPSAPCLAAR
ncbi:uncharacterized protein GGS25DRAFT_519868 [Hypoxylon fragiforme]|uniref:uncharacterized protein n=1 Tax=Hypoxylon fragiforme TaxID=63214 RepID=UPI0020C746BB|nr:uncharacterized protein GGS25DRAFT_519868 [Hypoxylon fragiforme]KAI2611562.1 hypothetical protein GGS25DRAFT_519868 [Hypoxylon fragiforme]